MPSNFNLPVISDLPLLEKLNSKFEFIEQYTDKIHYRNLFLTRDGDSKFVISMDLVFFDGIGLDVPLLEDVSIEIKSGNLTDGLRILIVFDWKILSAISNFTNLSNNESIEYYFQLVLNFFKIEGFELISELLFDFQSEELDVTALNEELSTFTGTTVSLSSDFSDPEALCGEILNYLNTNGLQAMDFIFDLKFKDLSIDDLLDQLNVFLSNRDLKFDLESLKKLLTPEIDIQISDLEVEINFPRKYLVPLYTNAIDYPNAPDGIEEGDELPEPFRSAVSQKIGSFGYSTKTGFYFNSTLDFFLAKSKIGKTDFTIVLNSVKFDFNRSSNSFEVPGLDLPDDFVGVFVTEGSIGFPTNWGHNNDNSSAELFVNNLLVGTGGISGTIGMRSKTPAIAADPEADQGLIQLKFGEGFEIGLKGFDLTFQQNAIISSNIHGFMKIPGFKHEDGSDAEIDIEIHIGQDGEFNIVVASDQPLKKIRVPNAFTFSIESMFFGRETGSDGRFYLGVSGLLDFTLNGELGQYLPDSIDIEKMLIYDDGKFEFEGGKLTLPKAISLSFGPAKLSITGINLGSYEKGGRKYKFFGFDGGVKVNPGGVDVQGKGIKYYYTVDDGDFKWFIGLESLTVDIIIPSGTDPEKAAVAIRGFLSISEPKIDPTVTYPPAMLETLQNSQEYIGGVSVSIPKFKGLKGSAAMRMNPKVPSFIIDLGIELATPIVLGATGLGIYGFRGLLGKKYVATKTAAGVPEDGEWWQYYKAKIDPDYHQGIQVSKFSIKNGFSFGAGVSLATATDSGKIFSSKLFFLLSLPDVFLFQGQAQFLKERIGIDADPDPPFFAIIAITNKSIEAGFGVNYKLRDEGKIVTVDGIIELGFFWGDSKAWYINVGRETPEDRRIQARLFDILNMYFYLMLSNNGIRLGAGVLFEKKKTFGPLSAELKAYIDTFGKISRRPKQIGGALKMGGSVSLSICGFGFGVSGSATLAGEAPKPHIVTGEFEVCVKILKKERCARFELTWSKDEEIDMTRVPLLVGTIGESTDLDTADVAKVAGSSHMVSGERFAIASKILGDDTIPAPGTWIVNSSLDDYRIPMDSFIDIEFKKGMSVSPGGGSNLDKIGGQSSPAQYVEFIPPMRGKSDRTRHEYYLRGIDIFYWKEDNDGDNDNAGVWEPYDFYEALRPIYENAPEVLASSVAEGSDVLANMKWGYWQQQSPGLNNKLRILATTPLSYTSSTGDSLNIEDLGINGSTIFCPGDLIPNTCLTFGDDTLYTTFPADTLKTYENVIFRIVNGEGVVLNIPYGDFDNGLTIPFGCKLEMFFNEPMKIANLMMKSSAAHIVIKYYRRQTASTFTNGLSTYDYVLVDTQTFDSDYSDQLPYTCEDDGAIDYITVEPNTCSLSGMTTTNVNNQATILSDIKSFLGTLIENHELTASAVELRPGYHDTYAEFLESTLYGKDGHIVNLTQTYFSPTGLSFRITDDLGFDCLWNLELKSEVYKFDYSTITGVKSVEMYTADDVLGENNNFLVTFNIGDEDTVQFIGSTCKTLSYSFDRCATDFYELCYLSLEDYLANQTVPDEAVQNLNNLALKDSINKLLQPVWRPNTTYAIRVKTADQLYRESGSDSAGAYYETVAYGFRTAGPIGHFHQYPKIGSGGAEVTNRQDYGALETAGKENEFRLSNLRYYIDYSKSYPNADSQLINAKPLFYNNAELRLFYLYNYVYQFYSDWVDYAYSIDDTVVKLAESSLEVVIINPAPSETAETELPGGGFQVNSIIRNSVSGQPPSLINEVNHEVSILNNLLIAGDTCAGYTPLIPIDISTRKLMNLKPNKLYTAQFIAKYKPAFDGVLTTEEFQSIVHSYVFQTSRYSSFAEQVNSYILKTIPATEETPEVVLKAIYPLELTKDFDSMLAAKVIQDDLDIQQDALVAQYTDRFEQLVNGVFGMDLNALQAAVRTEFNLVHRNGNLVGILIRNPEPFNDPKIPQAPYSTSSTGDLETLITFEHYEGDWEHANNFVAVHSKDKSQIFVTNRNFNFDMDMGSELKFEFKYKQYNGVAYADFATSEVVLDLTNYTI